MNKSWNDVLNTMLPPKNGIKAGITTGGVNGFCNHRPTNPPWRSRFHEGADVNYQVGQNGINLTHPNVFSPVSGEIIKIDTRDNAVIIRDANGYIHELRHFDTLTIPVEFDPLGTDPVRIKEGDLIGTMGNRGVDSPNVNSGGQHVDYKIKRPGDNKLIDPVRFWDGLEEITVAECKEPPKPTQKAVQQTRRDPLILDLNGDGIQTTGVDREQAFFDHDGNKFAEQTGWVSPQDGLLVWDRNGNGTIDSGREIFGDQTRLPNGQLAANGFAALAALDSNADGVVDANDEAYADLKIWRDLNQDGISQADELQTLADAGISAINLTANVQGKSTFIKDGVDHTVQNVNFSTNAFYREFTDDPTVTSTAAALPEMQGAGMVRDLREAMSLGNAKAATLEQALNNFKAGATAQARQALLEPLIIAWADTGSMGDPKARNPIPANAPNWYFGSRGQAIAEFAQKQPAVYNMLSALERHARRLGLCPHPLKKFGHRPRGICANNYRRYSERKATRRQGGATGTSDNPTSTLATYKARIALDQQHLKSPNGQTLSVGAGMQIVAEVNQGQRTVLEYLLSPVSRAMQEAGREK